MAEQEQKGLMKLFVASDIHGSAYWCRRMLEAYRSEKADRILLLGDLLYHGPRNDLPREYDPRAVAGMLNGLSGQILCVRGNCDSEVDQMVLTFPVMADYAVVASEKAVIYASHGHNYSASCPPPLSAGDILLCGHTHVPERTEQDGFIYMNPGSVSMPKENSPHSYMTLENGVFAWKNLETGTEYEV